MFLNLVMLAGIGGAVLPLVLHLLARSRYRTVEWGAMMFLEGHDPREARGARLRQWSLLAVRMGLVGTLALALARPVVSGRASGAAGATGPEGRVSAVIVLDRSFSLAHEEGGRSRFDRAREATLQILASLQKGDEASLVLVGEQVEVLYPEPTTNLQAAARAVADIQVSSGSTDLTAGLARARAILEHPTRFGRELYIVTDRQLSNWSALEGEAGRELRSWTANPRAPTSVYAVPVGGEGAENVAVESVALSASPAVRGHATEVEVRVRNFGGGPFAGSEVSVFLTTSADAGRRVGETGRPVARLPVAVGARSSVTLRAPITFDRAGSHVLTAEIDAPGLRDDNRFDAPVDVIEPLPVLILSGEERGPESGRESFYLRAALAPRAAEGGGEGDPAVVAVRAVEEFPRVDLSKYRVIVLANVPQLTPEQVRLLEQRVYDGAGLIIAPGNLTRVENFNRELYRDGQGLMPARLEAPTDADGSGGTVIADIDPEHPVFRFVRSVPGLVAGVGSGLAVTRHFPATPRAWETTTPARYASGEAFLVEGARGRGRVLLVTTPLDADWSTLPLHPFYLPMVQSAVRHAGIAPAPPRVLSPGEVLVATFDDPVEERSIVLTRNEERLANVTYLPVRHQVRFAETSRPGIYRLRVRTGADEPERVTHFVVQPPRRESDLTPIDAVRWAKLREAIGFEQLDPSVQRVAERLSSTRTGRELWLPLMLVVMGLAVTEMWLSRRWSREVA